MGNTNGGGSGSWRNEIVVSASHYSRPKIGGGPFDHHGVVMTTNEGNQFLVHSGPDYGSVVTPASNMSDKWVKGESITIKGTKTVQDAYNGASGRTNNKLTQYITGGTCIGGAKGAEKALKK